MSAGNPISARALAALLTLVTLALFAIFFVVFRWGLRVAVQQDDERERALVARPCSDFAEYKLSDVPARCVKYWEAK